MVQDFTACSATGKAPEHGYKLFLIFTILALALLSLVQAQDMMTKMRVKQLVSPDLKTPCGVRLCRGSTILCARHT
jgi:hypothetical protein